mmetsp:Transcript_33853/g.30655  ORF Transcript_33853/g.30655 Transcript_33853/m.30655 type:complete len:104 (+) Transcript_33853:258-569(+)
MIYVKIDPVNSTKVITFYISREEKKDEEEVLKIVKAKRNITTTYKLAISNVIGISLIDSQPKELISITFKDLNFTQTCILEDVGDSYGLDFDPSRTNNASGFL